MKMTISTSYIETSEDLEERMFSIGDPSVIFDVLRSKLYSNPILAICREISCNARDAHREVGTPHLPIHIHLPNSLEPYYKIKDFGPGIGPVRIADIYTKYGASTKRDNNIQTGFFGLGSKTPWSYTDSFSVVTNFNGVQYNYSCNIDETKVGKLMLLSESPTKEPNGTEIKIPVLPKDFTLFATWTEQACRHWTVKPIIKGGGHINLQWQEYTKVLEGINWAISSYDSYTRTTKIIIDGIEYPLELDTLRKYANSKLIDDCRGNFVMYFGIGELSLSANREQIYLDERTQNLIRVRLDEIQQEIKQKVVDKINTLPDLYQANLYYCKELRHVFNSLDFLGQITWREHPLHIRPMNLKCNVLHFIKGRYKRSPLNPNPDKISRSISHHLSFEENSMLYINDLPLKDPTLRHVRKAFNDNPQLVSLQVICPNTQVSIQDLKNQMGLDLMAPKLLSTITKASARPYRAPSSRLIIYRFDKCNFRQVSHASLEEDPNHQVLCLLGTSSSGQRHAVLKNKQYLSSNSIEALLPLYPDTSFYGVDVNTPVDRIKEDLSNLQELEDFITCKVLNNKSINFVEIKLATSIDCNHYHSKLLKYYPKLKSMITDPKSLFLKQMELYDKLKSLGDNNNMNLLYLYELINGEINSKLLNKFVKDHPDYDIGAMDKKYAEQYPLMIHLNFYDWEKILPHVAQYINLIDKQERKQHV